MISNANYSNSMNGALHEELKIPKLFKRTPHDYLKVLTLADSLYRYHAGQWPLSHLYLIYTRFASVIKRKQCDKPPSVGSISLTYSETDIN